MSFDATGSDVKKLKRPVDISGHIFLYQGVLSSFGDVLVVLMLSESHTRSSLISPWLCLEY